MDPIELPDASQQPQPRIDVRLSARESHLHQALAQKRHGLADRYHAALAILATFHHAEKFPLAAHSVRELMEKVPEVFGIARIGKGIPKPEVWALEGKWNAVCGSKRDGEWPEAVDKTLIHFLNAFAKFFDQSKSYRPKRKDQLGRLMHRLEPSERTVPKPLAKLRVQEWDDIWDYFKRVSHHSQLTTDEEFRGWLRALEEFLLNRLRPRTFADFEELDGLIAEGESHA